MGVGLYGVGRVDRGDKGEDVSQGVPRLSLPFCVFVSVVRRWCIGQRLSPTPVGPRVPSTGPPRPSLSPCPPSILVRNSPGPSVCHVLVSEVRGPYEVTGNLEGTFCVRDSILILKSPVRTFETRVTGCVWLDFYYG